MIKVYLERPLLVTFTMLLIIGILMNAAVLFAASNEVNRVRQDFCAWTTTQIQLRRTFPDRVEEAKLIESDRRLLKQLHCP